MDSYNESRLRQQIDRALERIRKVLAVERGPGAADERPHRYEDKFLLAETLTNTAIASVLNVLAELGLDAGGLKKLKEWSSDRSVTLQLFGWEKCSYDKSVKREVESATKHVTEYEAQSSSGVTTKDTHTYKNVSTVVEYLWDFKSEWELNAYRGSDSSGAVSLAKRTGQHTVITTSQGPKPHDWSPKPKHSSVGSYSVNITWLLSHINAQTGQLCWAIDRKSPQTRTPRRNPAISPAFDFFRSFCHWASSVESYFTSRLFPTSADHSTLDMVAINDKGIFVPVVPLMEAFTAETKPSELLQAKGSPLPLALAPPSKLGASPADATVLLGADVNRLLQEQLRSLQERHANLATTFPAPNKDKKAQLISSQEAYMLVLLQHSRQVAQHWSDGIDYIEDMLRKQIIAAIGKEVGPQDFTEYMQFHNSKLFRKAYVPRPFSYAVRRPDQNPEGVVSIERTLGTPGAVAEPVLTSVRSANAATPMSFAINAHERIQFKGRRYVHSFVTTQFSGGATDTVELVARARQFSSFMVVLGRIDGPDVFVPKYAFIVKDKDEFRIPLTFEALATPKEFKDRTPSISPDQERFVRMFRSMQLQSTLFGIAVLQIKPQLEAVVNLSPLSLTKEIRLNLDLMELFTKYNIPPDLLKYDGPSDARKEKKIVGVKRCVKEMYGMIEQAKQDELTGAARSAVFSVLSSMLAPSGPVVIVDDDVDRGGLQAFLKSIGRPAPTRAPQVVSASASSGVTNVSRPVDPRGKSLLAVAHGDDGAGAGAGAGDDEEPEEDIDYNGIPSMLDARMMQQDPDGVLRPTLINVANSWTKKSQASLLAKPTTQMIGPEEQRKERNTAYDLLDCITRAAIIPIIHAELHVVIAATHNFDDTLMNTLVQQSLNPIEKVERSTLLVSSVIHNRTPAQMIKGADQLQRVKTYAPTLF